MQLWKSRNESTNEFCGLCIIKKVFIYFFLFSIRTKEHNFVTIWKTINLSRALSNFFPVGDDLIKLLILYGFRNHKIAVMSNDVWSTRKDKTLHLVFHLLIRRQMCSLFPSILATMRAAIKRKSLNLEREKDKERKVYSVKFN